MADNRKRLDSLQTIRCIAFFCIFLFHGGVIWGNFGGFGASAFIVLSGFLMTYSYINKELSVKLQDCLLFGIGKIKRLYPLHIITMLMILAGLILISVNNGSMNGEYALKLTEYTALNVLLIQTYVPIIEYNISLNSVAWYLSVCLFIYCVFPLMLRVIKNYSSRKNAVVAMTVTYIFQVLISVLTANVPGIDGRFHTWITYCFPLFRAMDFFIGCNLGYLYLTAENQKESGKEVSGRKILITVFELICFGILPVLVWWSQRSYESVIAKAFTSTTVIFLPLSVAFIYLFALNEGYICTILTNKLTGFIGDMSAYMFLIHFVAIFYLSSIIGKLPVTLNRYIICAIYFIFTLLGAWIYSKLEKWLKNHKNS